MSNEYVQTTLSLSILVKMGSCIRAIVDKEKYCTTVRCYTLTPKLPSDAC